MKQTLCSLSAMTAATLFLVSCGGSSDPAPDAVAGSSASFAECFELTPGIKYSTSGTFINGQYTIVEELFDGTLERGVSLHVGTADTRNYVSFVRAGGGFIHFPGELTYDHNGDVKMINRTPDFRFQDNMQAGQSAVIAYVEEFTNVDPFFTNTSNENLTLTFEGFENLTLAGHTFADTCRIRAANASTPEETSVVWFAKGFGPIRTEIRDTQGNLIETEELSAIAIAP